MTDGHLRGAAAAAPRTGPLTIVTAAVAGDDLESVARSAADALGCSVAIALPRLGSIVAWPPEASSAAVLERIDSYAGALIDDDRAQAPPSLRHSVPIRIGREVVGVVVALTDNGLDPESWLEAAAAAAAVTALMRDASGLDAERAKRAFLQMLELHVPGDIDALLANARRLGCDLSAGAIGVRASSGDSGASGVLGASEGLAALAADARGALVAHMGDGRLLGLLPPGIGDIEASTASGS